MLEILIQLKIFYPAIILFSIAMLTYFYIIIHILKKYIDNNSSYNDLVKTLDISDLNYAETGFKLSYFAFVSSLVFYICLILVVDYAF